MGAERAPDAGAPVADRRVPDVRRIPGAAPPDLAIRSERDVGRGEGAVLARVPLGREAGEAGEQRALLTEPLRAARAFLPSPRPHRDRRGPFVGGVHAAAPDGELVAVRADVAR